MVSGLINNAIFNPNGNDSIENRSIWFGETTNLMQLNDVKYSWAIGLYNQLRENFWIPQKLDITQDVTDYNLLTDGERRAFDGILSYLTFLDSIQTCNLPHLKNAVTAPEVSMCMVEQLSQEAMHNASYQYMIETIIPSDRRNSVYEFWREDKVLAKRCDYIAGQYQAYLENPSGETYFTSFLADYILESLLFYNGFIYFYTLSSRMLMPGSSDVFKMINRDELSHVRLFQKMLPEAMETFVHSTDQIYETFDTAVQNEIVWTNHIIGQDILGITVESTEQYTKYLANIRLKAIGLDYLYNEERFKKSPYVHLERFADTKAEGNTKANFFEAGVTSYSMSSGISGWEF
jgi:ribonucleoside-diphosphate reductase beta chain